MADVARQGQPQRTKVVLILSAGAPHSPLMAGALCAFHEKNKTFDIVYTSGAGALIGLLFVAPKGNDPAKALRGLVELSISDPIYRLFPINYKVFLKPGPFTHPIHLLAECFKLSTSPLQPIPDPRTALGRAYNFWVEAMQAWQDVGGGGLRRLFNDLVDKWAAVITPTTLNYWSQGLCEPLPFLEDLVDFYALRHKFLGEFYVNALSPEVGRKAEDGERQPRVERSGIGKGMVLFSKAEIDARHVRAAFAYPFIYTPVKIDGRRYFEGADRDPISFGNLLTRSDKIKREEIKTLVLVDILGSLQRHLLREPRNLWDAFGLSIMVPVVSHARQEVARFEEALERREENVQPLRREDFLKVAFSIPDEVGAHILDWSYSNLSMLFELGREAGLAFCREHGDKLPTAGARGPTR